MENHWEHQDSKLKAKETLILSDEMRADSLLRAQWDAVISNANSRIFQNLNLSKVVAVNSKIPVAGQVLSPEIILVAKPPFYPIPIFSLIHLTLKCSFIKYTYQILLQTVNIWLKKQPDSPPFPEHVYIYFPMILHVSFYLFSACFFSLFP